MDFEFTAELVEMDMKGAWFFITLPKNYYDDIKELTGSLTIKGFGSVRVEARIGASTWNTSIFPSREKVYCLPVKKQIRNAEDLENGSMVSVELKILI